MSTLLKKINHKTQEQLILINAPKEFEKHKEEFSNFLRITENLEAKEYEFVLAFVQEIDDIKKVGEQVETKIVEDGLLWFAYPKKSSKIYKSEVNHWIDPLKSIGTGSTN